VLVAVAAGTPVVAARARRHPWVGRAAAAALVVAGVFVGSPIWFFAGAPADPRTIAGENAYALLMLALVLVLPTRGTVGRSETPFPRPPRPAGASSMTS
jgi:uncharacterized membrane protein